MKHTIIRMAFLIGLTTACSSPAEEPAPDRSDDADVGQKDKASVLAEPNKRPAPASPRKSVSPAPLSRPPNFIVVLLDTLRPDYLGFLGNEYETAPFLASLSKTSAVFENALSASSWTAPSVASLFTGLYPPQHQVTQGFRAHRGIVTQLKKEGEAELKLNRLPPGVPTLPELFKSWGYRTFGLAANINIGKEIGFSRGFDRFEKHVKAPAESLFEIVSKWREEIIKSPPFFLYLHFNDPHTPYHMRKPYFKPVKSRKENAAARYRSEIGYVDEFFRKTWQLPGLSENTTLVILSDHGEEFWDHGSTEHGPTLYGELNRVVMMIHGPSQGISARRTSENVSLIDILPTLAELAEKPLAKNREGISLVRLLEGNGTEADIRKRLDERCLFGHRMYSSRRNLALWSITCRNWKLIDWWGDRRKLFDHGSDRGEYHDLFPKRPKVAGEIYSRLVSFKKRMESGDEASVQKEIELDEGLLKKLRSMGYLE